MVSAQAANCAATRPPGIGELAGDTVWAVSARVVYALSQLVMVAAVASLCSPAEAGGFIFALAVTGPIFMLTNLQLRTVLITDTDREFPFACYRQTRRLSVAAVSAVVCVAALCFAGAWETRLVLIGMTLARAFESVSDIHLGLLEREGRIPASSRSLILRGVLSVLSFCLLLYVTRNVAFASLALATSSAVVLLHDMGVSREVASWCGAPASAAAYLPTYRQIAALIKRAWPLGLATLLMSLQVNFPRLWTGYLFGEQALGIFGVLFQIGIAGQILASAVCTPLLPRISKLSGDADSQNSVSTVAIGAVVLIGLVLGAVISVVLRPVLQLAVTPRYLSEELLIRVVSLTLPLYFVHTSLSFVFRAKRRFRFIMLCELGSLTMIVILSLWAGEGLGLTGTALAFTAALWCTCLVYLTAFLAECSRMKSSERPRASGAWRARDAA